MSLRNGKSNIQSGTTGRFTSDNDNSNMSVPSTIRRSVRAQLTPYLLLIYPIIIGLGSAFYHISPIANSHATGYSAPSAPGAVSDQHAVSVPHTLSYFANKRNVFNVYFVKIGWFWTTLAFVLLPLTVLQSRSQTSSSSSTTTTQEKQKKSISIDGMLRSYLRYTLITLSWIFTTQWFFGAPLTERSFIITGGHCEAVPATAIPSSTTPADTTAQINKLPGLLSEIACKAAGGRWRGGHDISGHVFMLVLSSAFLLYELSIIDSLRSHLLPNPLPHISPKAAANISKDLTEEEKNAIGGWETGSSKSETPSTPFTVSTLRPWIRRFVYTVITLDLWMLMMTAVFFHTWLEKLTGLLVAAGTLWGVYFSGEILPVWDNIVGL